MANHRGTSWADTIQEGGVSAGALASDSDTGILLSVETSIQTTFTMTVKVDGVAQDGTTKFIHNAHNLTRTPRVQR